MFGLEPVVIQRRIPQFIWQREVQMTVAYPIDFQRFEGIYEIPEVARFIVAAEREKYRIASESLQLNTRQISSRSLLRWIRKGLSLRELRDVPGRNMLITFEDVISMRVITALRAAGVTFPKIYTAERWLRLYTGHSRPFAVEAIWTQRTEVFTEFKQMLIAASRAGQLALDLFQDYIIPISGLTFVDDVATTWEPSDGVLLDPEIQFGSPCIKGTRVPTRTIWGMIQAGDSKNRVARSFNLTQLDIDAATTWEESLAA
jgi:uncharacterized protein (DUF433 family)